ncbi:hypothetical protein [Streptomyces sp. NPDC041003]|uniref:hypothetical protein n=1 Tax=Streptomyces sp. NPDC041003 TaxID=3155730 RepID=UPI0033F62F23
MADFIQYIECTHGEWKKAVHREIEAADCILLYIAPKADKFPVIKRPEAALPYFEQYYDAPFKNLSTGVGLLHEIAYIDRLGKIENTVAICREHESKYIWELIGKNSWQGISVFTRTVDGIRATSSRLLAPDRQLARLQGAAGIVAFTDADLTISRSRFARLLRRAVKAALGRHHTQPRALRQGWQSMVGVSPTPRPLPPDYQLKIISHTDVENLLHIPNGNITEMAAEQATSRLNRRAARKGCPTCGAGLSNLFFYINGLGNDEPDQTIWAKCQNCMAYLMVENWRLLEV